MCHLPKRDRNGTYEVKSSDGDTSVVTMTIEDDAKDITVKFSGDDTITLTMPDGDFGPGSIVLNRVDE